MAKIASAAATIQIALIGSPRRSATTPRHQAPTMATTTQASFATGPDVTGVNAARLSLWSNADRCSGWPSPGPVHGDNTGAAYTARTLAAGVSHAHASALCLVRRPVRRRDLAGAGPAGAGPAGGGHGAVQGSARQGQAGHAHVEY